MPIHLGDTFTQLINKTEHYFTHYAQFEEPDDNVPNAIYIDATTGQPTQELSLVAPLNLRNWTRTHHGEDKITAPTETSKLLPYFVDPPGFPPLPPPPQVVAAIVAATGLPDAVVTANTKPLLVAIGQFIAAGDTTGRIQGPEFHVHKTMRFQVRIRIGFIFTPPGGGGQGVGILTGFLTFGLLHQLIGLPPPANPDDLVIYDWKAEMHLSTEHKYVRQTATEPAPVADPFAAGETEIRFEGQRIDHAGHYKIVGHAKPADVTFTAPPELVQFLFHVNQLTDVEFAVSEEGVLQP
jgi:hypothetical protein